MRLDARGCSARIVKRPPLRCGAGIKWANRCATRAVYTSSCTASRGRSQWKRTPFRWLSFNIRVDTFPVRNNHICDRIIKFTVTVLFFRRGSANPRAVPKSIPNRRELNKKYVSLRTFVTVIIRYRSRRPPETNLSFRSRTSDNRWKSHGNY